MKKFNVTGLCVPEDHYMVNIEVKKANILNLIHDRQYFTINRARQFGKTTTLALIEKILNTTPGYICVSLTFEGVGDTVFETEESLCNEFLAQSCESLHYNGFDCADDWIDESIRDFAALGRHISRLCKDRKIVLLIDEVDATSSNRVFLRFLEMLRSLFLKRTNKKASTFHSVVLAGVHDIKNIKLKLVSEGVYSLHSEHEGEYNSPWNIATDFTEDMSFSASEISTMLVEYEKDHATDMDMTAVSKEIYRFTNGYPVLVSKICKCIDEELPTKEWSVCGVQSAVNKITFEKSVLYDDIFKNLENHKDLHDFIYGVLVSGNKKKYTLYNPVMERANTFGFITTNSQGIVEIANKLFAIMMMNYFISKEHEAQGVSNQICNG